MLQELEHESDRRVYTVPQLRHHPALTELQSRIAAALPGSHHDVTLTYITARGGWYDVS